MKTLFMKFPYLSGTVTAGVMVAILLSGCATHRYAPADSYARQDRIDVTKYGDDWFAAARAGRGDILQALHDAGYPIDAKTPDGYTALVLAAYNDHAPAVKQLIAAGADACAADKRGNTALMGALFKGEDDVATLLMDTRCDIDQVNNAGETALGFATLFGRTEMLAPLVAHGANPNHRDARGGTPLQLAQEQRTPEVAAALRRVGATQ
jgi:ankyrin repeat protein